MIFLRRACSKGRLMESEFLCNIRDANNHSSTEMTYGAIRELTPYHGNDAVLEARLKRFISTL